MLYTNKASIYVFCLVLLICFSGIENGEYSAYCNFDNINGKLKDGTAFNKKYVEDNDYYISFDYDRATQNYYIMLVLDFETQSATVNGCQIFYELLDCYSDDCRVSEYWSADYGGKDLMLPKFDFSYS